jgi:hypothetical protein
LESGVSLHEVAQHHEIFPGRKITHFKRIHERTGIQYNEMLVSLTRSVRCGLGLQRQEQEPCLLCSGSMCNGLKLLLLPPPCGGCHAVLGRHAVQHRGL